MQKKSLRDYQLVDLSFYMQNPRCANLSDPGTGKTPPTCVYMYWLWTQKNARTFFVMPKSLLKKNAEELIEFTHFTEEDVVIYDGTPKQREKLRQNSKAKVWLMGFRRFADEWRDLKKLHPDFNALIVDEIHMGFGGHTSNQTTQMYQSMKYLEYFVAMTGTLINGRLDSAYPTIKVIEPRYYSSHQSFLSQHGIFDVYGSLCAWKGHDKLARIFRQHTIKRAFIDVYGQNQVVTQTEVVPMAKKQREIYDTFQKEAVLELEDQFMDAGGVEAVAVTRLRQIMAHPENVTLPVKWDEDGKPIEFKDYNLLNKNELTGKDERLMVHLADHKNTGEPLIIFAALKKEIDRIEMLCLKQGFKVGKIHGGVPAKKRAQIDERFRAGSLDIVVASPETASVGYNWGHVNHIIFASIDYKDSNYIQARRRAERGVRNLPLRVTVLEYERSVDQKIFAVVERKSNDAHLVDKTNAKIKFKSKAPNVQQVPKGQSIFPLGSMI